MVQVADPSVHRALGRSRHFDKVAVVCDHRTVESALSLRGVLEQFPLRTRPHRLVRRAQALAYFAGHASSCPYPVLMSLAIGG